MKRILVSLVFIPHLITAMADPSVEREKQAERITDEIAALRKQKEKTAVLSLLTMSKQSLELDWKIYNKLVKFCSYEHVPLMKALLENTLNANSYYCMGEHNEYRVTLLTKAVGDACENKELGMVRLLLEKGANPRAQSLLPSDNQELNMMRGAKYDKRDYMSPLHRVASTVQEESVSLVSLLVEHGADLNVPEYGSTCFMQIVSAYTSLIHQTKGPTDNSNKRYELIAKCLSRGAQIDVPSKCEFGDCCILTPIQFARREKRTELVKLFEEHQKKGNNA